MTTTRKASAGNPVNIILKLARCYGSGAKNNFFSQVYSRATEQFYADKNFDEFIARSVYFRLCDFGVIAEYGSLPNTRWQWQSDQLYISSDNHLVFLAALEQVPEFASLDGFTEFERISVWSTTDRTGQVFSLDYLVSKAPVNVPKLDQWLQFRIPVSTRPRFIRALPSAREIYSYLARAVESLPPEDELEARTAQADHWRPVGQMQTKQTLLIRRQRPYSPGYQYWLSTKWNRDLFEVDESDWLYLLFWWVSRYRWTLHYKEGCDTLYLPTKIFYKLPGTIRQSLIQAEFQWPTRKVIFNDDYFQFLNIKKEEAKYLENLYQPAIEIKYEH